MKSLVIIFALLFAVGTLSSPIGVKVAVTQEGMQFVGEVVLNELQKNATKEPIPDQSIDQDGFTITLSQITLQHVQFNDSGVVVTSSGIAATLTNVQAQVSANWHAREDDWPHVSSGGGATITVSSLDISANLLLVDVNGVAQLQVVSDNADVGSLNVELSGGDQWIKKIIAKWIGGELKKILVSQIEQQIVAQIKNNVDQKLASMSYSYVLMNEFEFSFALAANPDFANGYSTLPILGEWYSISNHQECPPSVCPTPNLPDTISTDMVQVLASEFSFNSLFNVLYVQNMLKVEVNNAEIPAASPFNLNTSKWRTIIPTLYEMYPNDLMVVDVSATEPPMATIDTAGIHIDAHIELAFTVLLANQSRVPAFAISGSVAYTLDLSATANLIIGTMTYGGSNFTETSSEVGPLNMFYLGKIMDLVFGTGATAFINAELAKGFPVPVIEGFALSGTTFAYQNGFVGISSNLIVAN